VGRAVSNVLVLRKIRTLIEIFPRIVLRLIFRFDRWHLSSFRNRDYAKEVVAIINSFITRDSILEIGCGLGDILRRAKFKSRVGVDIDKRVIRAAKVLQVFHLRNKKRADFICRDFLTTNLSGVYEAIVLVNWIHDIETLKLKERIDYLWNHNLSLGGSIVIDLLENPEYSYNHKIERLTASLSADVTLYKYGEHGRRIARMHKVA
jgi:SAM-dependent methyltransferase